MNFVRSVATQVQDTKDEAQLAAIVFDAMGVAGLTYLPDPANPDQAAPTSLPLNPEQWY